MEAALTAIIFLTVLFGIVGLGRAVWAYSWTAHAAREGSRWASVRGEYGAEVATTGSVSAFVTSNMMGLDPAQAVVTTTWDPDNSPGSTVQVQVQYNVTRLVPWVPAMTVRSTSRMPIAQ